MPTAVQNDRLIEALSPYFVRSFSTSYGLSSAISSLLSFPMLRALWSFTSYDENGNMYDLSGQGRTLTNNNTVAINGMHGVLPYADFVRASSESFSRADEAGLSITDSLSIAVLAYFDAESTGNETGIVSKWVSSSNKCSYALIKTTGDVFRFEISNDGITEYTLDSAVVYSAAQWYFMACQFVPSTSMHLFVNGTWSEDITGIPASIYDNDQALYLGAHNGGNYLDGRMSFTAIAKTPASWSRVVIESLYHHIRPLVGLRS